MKTSSIYKTLLAVYSLFITIYVSAQAIPATTPSSGENYILTIEPILPNPVADGQSPGRHTVQYFDGLGRPKQTVMSKNTTTGLDMIIHYEYDGFGRQVKDYLPVRTGQTSGAYVTDPISKYNAFYNSPTTYNTQVYYSEKELENSPLNRVLKQAAPGEDWKLTSGHEIKFEHQTNTGADEVIIFYANATWNDVQKLYTTSLVKTKNVDGVAGNEKFYPTGYLYKNITTDENGSKIEEYKNKQGQIVMKRSFSTAWTETNLHRYDTYYVYDNYGNLTYVIPPKLLDLYFGGTLLLSSWQTQMNELGYQYRYDNRNRLVEKVLPGKAVEYMVYDSQDRLVATQDALQRAASTWLFTKYDKFGRVVMTGNVWEQGTREAVQSWVNSQFGSNNAELNTTGFPHDNITIYYKADKGYPASGYQITSLNYYDNYLGTTQAGFTPPTTAEKIEDQDTRSGGTAATESLKGLLTSTTMRVLGTWDWEHTYNVYDVKGRVVRNYKVYHPQTGTKGHSIVSNKLDFRGKPELIRTVHRKPGTTVDLEIVENLTYDMQERLLTHTHKIGNKTTELISANSYDQLGQLMNKKIGGTNLTGGTGRLQQVDYKYNIRGWLTQINNPDVTLMGKSAAPPNGSSDDLFAFKIQYNELTHGGQIAALPLYNGNISQTFWKSSANNVIRGYSYEYDQLNRLRHAHFNLPLSATTSHYSGAFDEEMTYDKNGNIMTMKRNLEDTNNGTAIDMDNLAYTYTANSNKLLKVTDATNNTAGFTNGASGTSNDYTYDVNGNMTSDLNKGITNITYNHLNLPTAITWTSTKKIEYLYNAAGVKTQKKVTNGTAIVTTNYLDGFQYVNGVLQFFPTAEGYVKNTVLSGQNTYDYVYNYTDHLGNIRLSYTKDPATGEIEILEENHYYPFGLKHSRYAPLIGKIDALSDNSGKAVTGIDPNSDAQKALLYKYKYNGKELQDELGLNMYDYGARNYDPALGRWTTMDNLSELYFETSSYVYAKNTPIQAIDPDGNLVIFINGNHFGEGSKGYRKPGESEYGIYGKPRDYNFSGTSAYWGSFDNKVKSHLNDNNAIYRDGSLGGWGGAGAKSRHNGGEKQGYLDAKQIIKNLERDKTTGEIIETIKIITHSMGGTYGKGYVKGLLKYIKEKGLEKSVRITLVADFDPFQAASSYTNAHPDIYTQQFTHIGTLADEKQSGVDDYYEDENQDSHSISTFTNDISKLKEGTYKWNEKTKTWDCTTCKD